RSRQVGPLGPSPRTKTPRSPSLYAFSQVRLRVGPEWGTKLGVVLTKAWPQVGENGALRVLVVDDETYITELVGTALRYEGFQVEEAGGGRAAMATATSFRPDLVVLDVMLPDIDGFEVTRRLR